MRSEETVSTREARDLLEHYGTYVEAAEASGWSPYQLRRAIKKEQSAEPLSKEDKQKIRSKIIDWPHKKDHEIANDMNSRYRVYHVREVRNELETGEDEEDNKIIEECSRQAKKAQKMQDLNRVERKTWRENSRIDNAVGEYSANILELLKKHAFHTVKKEDCRESDSRSPSPAGVIHVTDTHFNELINVPGNSFDFGKAAKRLKKLADRAVQYYRPLGVTEIALCFTGDLLNSDRRLDELLNQATNRSKATFLAVDLLKQFIEHLNCYFNITVAGVSGNESRISQEVGYSDDAVTDNYDFTILNILRYMFTVDQSQDSVTFLTGDPFEKVISVKGKNILLTHGYDIGDNCERTVAQIKARYLDNGVNIHYVLFGHLHSARVGDLFGRGASLCGANDYSQKKLNLSSRASQNIYVVHDDGNMDGIKVDLQEANNPGYSIDKSLEAYNAKSAVKAKDTDRKTVMHIVV